MKNLNKKVVSILSKKKVKLAIAESCTGGMLSSAITSVSGSSKVFTMGLVTYSNKSKNLLLKIPNIIIKNYGAVSSQCCSYMVNNLSKISKTNLAVSITGVAGPGGGTNLKPVGLVYIGIKNKDKIKIYKYLFKKKKRSEIQKSTVKKALQLIFLFDALD